MVRLKKIEEAKTEVESQVQPVVEIIEAPEVVELPKGEAKTEATVTWRGNSRTYSLELHGKDFMKLAKQFATKFDGIIR